MDAPSPKPDHAEAVPEQLPTPPEIHSLSTRSALRVLLWIVLGIFAAECLWRGLPWPAWPGSPLSEWFVHAALLAACLFVTLYFFVVGPLLLKIGVFEWTRTQLRQANEELEADANENAATLAQLRSKLESEIAERQETEAQLRQMIGEKEHQLEERTGQWQSSQQRLLTLEEQASANAALLRESQERCQTLLSWRSQGQPDAATQTAAEAGQELLQESSRFEVERDAIVLCDAEYRILSWSQGAARIYGWAAEEVLGRSSLDILSEKPLPPFSDEILSVLREKGRWRGELNQTSKDGRRLVVDARLQVTRPTPGTPSSLLMITTDRTESKAQQARKLREERLVGLSNFAGALARELNDALAPVLLAAPMLRTRQVRADDEQLAATIEASAQRTSDLLKEALVFARTGPGGRTRLDAGSLLNEVATIVRETFPRNLQVLLEIAEGLWELQGHPTQLHQALLKLAVHARDAMPTGGILHLRGRNLRLDRDASSPSTPPPGCYVALEIQDTGNGIPMLTQERLFEPFAASGAAGALGGLGLFTALGIVRNHDGFIEVRSQAGAGTTFQVLLPALDADVPSESSQDSAARVRGQGELILLVEEDTDLRDVTRKILAQAGYQVSTVSDGLEALRLLAERQGQVRLILTAFSTPSLDATALARAARKLDPLVRVIASSAFGPSPGQADKLAALQSVGVARLILKPYSAQQLLQSVREELALRCVAQV